MMTDEIEGSASRSIDGSGFKIDNLEKMNSDLHGKSVPSDASAFLLTLRNDRKRPLPKPEKDIIIDTVTALRERIIEVRRQSAFWKGIIF